MVLPPPPSEPHGTSADVPPPLSLGQRQTSSSGSTSHPQYYSSQSNPQGPTYPSGPPSSSGRSGRSRGSGRSSIGNPQSYATSPAAYAPRPLQVIASPAALPARTERGGGSTENSSPVSEGRDDRMDVEVEETSEVAAGVKQPGLRHLLNFD